MSSRKVEMVWRCSACDTENLGRHKVCQSCGDPKDPAEKFVMPSGDTRALATVTDPELLKKANAGRDWVCGSCGANQSSLGDRCTQCGARNPKPAPAVAAKPAPKVRRPAPARGAVSFDVFATAMFLFAGPLGFAGLIAGGGALFVGGMWWLNAPRGPIDVPATVTELRWWRSVAVDRYALRDFEGFAENRPQDAADVRSLGQRHHHDEQVLDHYRTESYTEEVPDGYDTRSYTEQVACGEDCTYSAPDCSESCTSDENGFATCTETCTGGGNTCTTRYCTEYRTEQVPRTRTEYRTREVPEYRSEPRYAEAFAWRAWRWAPDRSLDKEGVGSDAVWPSDDELHLGVGLAPGEDERAQRSERYSVTLAGTLDDVPRTWTLDGLTEAEWRGYAPGSAHVARVASDGSLLAVDPPAAP